MRILCTVFAFVVAVVAATIGLSAVSTFSVLGNLKEMGYPASFGEQISTYLGDLAGLGPIAGAINAIGLLIAFIIAALIIRFVWNRRTLGYILAGFVALYVEMLAMGQLFGGITPIAGARTMGGMVLIGAVGALSGFIFARLSARD